LKKTLCSFFVFIFPLLFFASCKTAHDKASFDVSIVVPGKMAEGYILGDALAVDENLYNIPVAENDVMLFKNLFELCELSIKYNRILYARNRFVIFADNDAVKCIVGFNMENRVTDDAVRLSLGISNFVLNYGNKDLKIKKNGANKIYLYKGLGIAVFDDYGDNSIDMYMIFDPQN